MTPSPLPWPQDAPGLALLAADPARSQAERNRALTELAPVIRAIAEAVVRGFRPEQVQHDLVDESVSHIWERLDGYRRDERPFEAWLRTVLYNRACDLRRRRRRKSDPLAHAYSGQAQDESSVLMNLSQPQSPSQEAALRLAEEFLDLRSVLDSIVWPAGSEIDYCAVWLFHLRVLVAAHFRRYLGGQSIAAGEIAAQVERWMVWHTHEERRRFRPDWPCLSECWQAICPLLADTTPTAAQIVDILAGRCTGTPITLMRWYQWINRARAEARARTTPEVWEKRFTLWLPSRDTSSREGPT